MEAVRDALRSAHRPTALLAPRAAGSVAEICGWVLDAVSDVSLDGPETVPDWESADPDLLQRGLVARFCSLDPADASAAVRILIADEPPDDGGPPVWERVGALEAAQARLGRRLVCPLVVSHAPPTEPLSGLLTIVFGPPRMLGSLAGLPDPDHESLAWRSLLLRSVAAWECGGIPARTSECAEHLDRTVPDWAARGFDAAVNSRLKLFADGLRTQMGLGPEALRRLQSWARPIRRAESPAPWASRGGLDYELWHSGALVAEEYGPDLCPAAARMICDALADSDDRSAVRRRRLAAAPLSRWLAAWAATVEDALRVAVLQDGDSRFRTYLEKQPPRRNADRLASRWSELLKRGDSRAPAAALAETSDLVGFLELRRPQQGPMLRAWQEARNRIVHERSTARDDAAAIARTVSALRREGML
jgi:hypothetical protein